MLGVSCTIIPIIGQAKQRAMSTLQLYLASTSPRRRQLLQQIGVQFERVVATVDESVLADEAAADYVCRLARAKAQAGWQQVVSNALPPHPVLGADTSVVIDGQILGKPVDRAHAVAMLLQLSGREHHVYSAVAVVNDERMRVVLHCSQVRFRELSQQQCERYWETGEPADKAGGYGIQGIGASFVQNLTGSHSGVMGLPLYETVELLQHFGIAVI